MGLQDGLDDRAIDKLPTTRQHAVKETIPKQEEYRSQSKKYESLPQTPGLRAFPDLLLAALLKPPIYLV